MKRVLVANRGEIAIRIQKTLLRMGIEPVAVYHSDESGCLHTKNAAVAVNLGKGSLRDTYLNISKIIAVAKDYSCVAIHPGYGFLSENPDFAKSCEENNIKFIGPKSDVIQQMGLKSKAKEIAVRAGVPVLNSYTFEQGFEPGKGGLDFPVLIKAVAGGGGKGMKVVHKPEDFQALVEAASHEARKYFGNGELFVEPYLEHSRHIEVQVLGDEQGNIVHLFERECSLQRNHQKIIEEAPATSISDELRGDLHKAAVKFAKELHYTNAGTVEFLVNGNQFYFLEMNTRIQVEHPVTEMITGIDLVEEQINVAQGFSLSEKVKNVLLKGHAIEARIYAENPYQSFMASTGEISMVDFPGNTRIDTFIEAGTQITPHFDSMLAKMVVHASSRNEAIIKLVSCIQETHIHGVKTNLSYLMKILSDSEFLKNNISTLFLHQTLEGYTKANIRKKDSIDLNCLVIAFVYINYIRRNSNPHNLWERIGPNSFPRQFKVFTDGNERLVDALKNFNIRIDGEIHQYKILAETENSIILKHNNQDYKIHYSQNSNKPYDNYEINGEVLKIATPIDLRMSGEFLKKRKLKKEKIFNQIVSPLFGKVIDIRVKENDKVKKGDLLLTIESMKTENQILAPSEGFVKSILVHKGLQVEENKELITLNPGIE